MPQELPYEVDSKVTANVAVILLTHTLAFLLRRQRINHDELQEIFRTTATAYSSTAALPPPTDDWQRQVRSLLSLIHNDVLKWAERV